MKKIIIALLGLSVALLADLTRDDSTQIVTDNSTTLQWQDDTNITKSWTEAISYCEALTLGGHSDWRLPNFNELYSIADHSKRDPAIDNTFINVVSRIYWSSTTVVGYVGFAWYVGFYFGDGYWVSKSNGYFVRCVRDGQ